MDEFPLIWCQHESLPQGEPHFRYLLHGAGHAGALLQTNIIIHMVEDGSDVLSSIAINKNS